mmetsp:Transcript_9111/g.17174  ORF Transcript_9111/g.17174 Transcript_9111/m.17174 type:complete len:220 (+) Transcript_9111:2761-3420(+)
MYSTRSSGYVLSIGTYPHPAFCAASIATTIPIDRLNTAAKSGVSKTVPLANSMFLLSMDDLAFAVSGISLVATASDALSSCSKVILVEPSADTIATLCGSCATRERKRLTTVSPSTSDRSHSPLIRNDSGSHDNVISLSNSAAGIELTPVLNTCKNRSDKTAIVSSTNKELLYAMVASSSCINKLITELAKVVFVPVMCTSVCQTSPVGSHSPGTIFSA